VFVIHDLIPLTFSEETGLLKKLYYNLILGVAVRRAKMVLTVSEFSKQEIIDHFGLDPEKIAVVGNGVDERFRPEGPTHDRGEPYLLYVGNTRPHKNVEAAIEGYARSGIQDQVRLLLSGSPTPSLMEVVRANGVEEAVDFADFIPEEELPAYYRGATALVHPSLHEGFGLPVLEALACGTAVVASNATAIPEVTGDAAHLFDPTNISEIASAMRKVVLDDSFRTLLEKRGPERAKKFSWEGVARRTESALRAAVA
jgi:glycosyltransferase involved in cell wall biosynthesis